MDAIDIAAWRDTLAHLNAWEKAVQKTQARESSKKSQQQKWREFLAIMEFGLKLKPHPSCHEQRSKVMMLEEYYRRLHRFELWRS